MLLKNFQLFTNNKHLKFISIILLNLEIFSQNTSMNFLKIPPTSRQAAVVGYSAFSDDIGGIFVNPAGIVKCVSAQIGMSHTQHFQDIMYEFAGFILPKKNYVLSFGLSFFHIDNIEGRMYKDLDPEYVNIYQTTSPEYYYSNYALQGGIGFSKKIFENYLFGSTLKVISESISETNSSTLATDIGCQILLRKIENFNLAFALNNLGFPVKYGKKFYPLPTQIVFGSSYRIKNISFLTDLVYPTFDKDDFYIGFGSEILIFEYLSLRIGYKYKPYGWYLKKDDFAGLSGGVGFSFFGTRVDYSLVSFGVLGLSHRISFLLELDKIGKFYELFRNKMFKIQPSISEIMSQENQEVLKSIKQQKEKPLDLTTKFFSQEFKVSTININLVSVDSQNRIFMYEVKLSSRIKIGDDLFLEKLNTKISSKFQLKDKETVKVYFSDYNYDESPKKVLFSKIFDFTEILKSGSAFEFELEFSSSYPDVIFYLLDKNNKISEINKEIYYKDNSLYCYKLKLPSQYNLLLQVVK